MPNASPKASVAVRVPGWRLTYDLRGFPFVEPAFADIEPLEAGDSTCPEVQGVCHQITVEEWERIVATEGGGGVAKHGYHSVHVDCIPLNQADKTPIRAVSLSVGNDPIMKHHGFLHLPSRRYVNLIIDGAKHYCLQDDYIQWLETHQSYDRKEHIKHKPIFYVAMAGLLFLAPPVFAFIALNVLFHRILPKLIYQKWAWLSHTTLRSIGNLAWVRQGGLQIAAQPLALFRLFLA